MTDAFSAMKDVRAAYDAVVLAPNDPVAIATFAAAHQAHANTYVEAFDVGGVTYPRTDGHKLSEREARGAISRLLASGSTAMDFRPSVIRAAYPLPEEVVRQEVVEMVALAKDIVALNWRTDVIDDATKTKVRALLRMPTDCGSYKTMQKAKTAAGRRRCKAKDQQRPYDEPLIGYDADHLIPDQVLRGSCTRNNSATKAGSYATWLQDSQNEGSQHRFATNAQNEAKKKIAIAQGNQDNPTLGQYMEYVFEWMTDIYTMADLSVDIAIHDTHLGSGEHFEQYAVKGFALAQAGFMTWPERQLIGKAVATVLMIDALEFYASINMNKDYVLPLFSDIPPTVTQQPVPNTSSPT